MPTRALGPRPRPPDSTTNNRHDSASTANSDHSNYISTNGSPPGPSSASGSRSNSREGGGDEAQSVPFLRTNGAVNTVDSPDPSSPKTVLNLSPSLGIRNTSSTSPPPMLPPSVSRFPPPPVPMPFGGMGNIHIPVAVSTSAVGGLGASVSPYASVTGEGSTSTSVTGSAVALMQLDYLARVGVAGSRPSSKVSSSHYTRVGSTRSITSPFPRSTEKLFAFAHDPRLWGSYLYPQHLEEDDALHDPRVKGGLDTGLGFSFRGLSNVGCLVILIVGLVGLFVVYPIAWEYTRAPVANLAGQNVGGRNGTGQVPSMGTWGLIDSDTPEDAYNRLSWDDNSEMQLVFSDEFNVDGRSFYPGDDPYWEAVDLHYWATVNLEWYDPAAVTTADGKLRITFSQKATHGLNYQSGMLMSWNKFCFTGGYIETSVSLPGQNDVEGLWPAIWTLGNLGRAGYGASLEGLWPYTYDSCDVGTVANQTRNGLPLEATVDGDDTYSGALSYLPGQRLSRCTCAGEDHPGPVHSDGTFVGRAAPEIDVFEAQVGGTPPSGEVSLSAQWAPFNYNYDWFNTTGNFEIRDPTTARLNTYRGGAFQQATSVVADTNQECYTGEGGCFSVYGFEYEPGYDNSYITWISNNNVAWTLRSGGMAADTRVEISARPMPQEPMYIIMNLGMSRNFGNVELDLLQFPVVMEVDYVRVYQKKGKINIGCDPADFPTASYIEKYAEAYSNPNLTTWVDDYKQAWPKNSFLGEC